MYCLPIPKLPLFVFPEKKMEVEIFSFAVSTMSSFVSTGNWRDTARGTRCLVSVFSICFLFLSHGFQLCVWGPIHWHSPPQGSVEIHRWLLVRLQCHPYLQLSSKSHTYPGSQFPSLGPPAFWKDVSCVPSICGPVLTQVPQQNSLQSSGL